MSEPRTVNQFVEEALDDLLSQPWMGIPEDKGITPPWSGIETVEELIADYRHSLRKLQMKWLYETLIGNGGEPPTPAMAAQCNGRIQIAEAVRRDLLVMLDHAKGVDHG
ncbi:hypothetical protein SEA_SHAGRAT_71 [Rhodococcus phage Shagrat]|nr:hypothetical protein SEA_SHAGRAT_71 [Rhodococcus phage Shagrat]